MEVRQHELQHIMSASMPTNTTTLVLVCERAVWRMFVWFQTGAKDSVLVVVIVGAVDGITVALFAKIAWKYHQYAEMI